MLELAREVGGELSIPIEAFESAAAGSSAFRRPSTPTLDGLGPLGSDLMTMQENIDLDSLVPRAAMLTEIIHRLPGLLRL
jgi:glutamate carboxypeptidase